MRDHALETALKRQIAAVHRRIRMRPTSLSQPLRDAAVFAIFVSFFIFSMSTTNASDIQEYLVCREPRSKCCVIWLTEIQGALASANSIKPKFDITEECGMSDLKTFQPRYKRIQASRLKDEVKVIFVCDDIRVFDVDEKGSQVLRMPKSDHHVRKRQVTYPTIRGRYRGQTQSQYLAIDRGTGKDDGKAEAHSAADSSRASVSGSSGMGQAQSQTMYDPSCEDCHGRSETEAENLRRPPNAFHRDTVGGHSIDSIGLPGGSQYSPGVSGTYGTINNGAPSNIAYGSGQVGRPSENDNGGFGNNRPGNLGNKEIYTQGKNEPYKPGSGSLPEGSTSGNGFGPYQGTPGGTIYGINNGSPGISNSGSFVPGQSRVPTQKGFGPNQEPGSLNPNQGSLSDGHSPSNNQGIFGPNLSGSPNTGNFGQIGHPSEFSPGPGTYGLDQQTPAGTPNLGTYPNNLGGGYTGTPYGHNQQIIPDSRNLGPNLSGIPSGNGIYGTKNGPLEPGVTSYGSNQPSLPGTITGSLVPNQQGFPGGTGSLGSGQIGGPNRVGIYDSNTPVGTGHTGIIPQGHLRPYGPVANLPQGSGSFVGPDGTTYYCCIAGPNNNPQIYKTNDGSPGTSSQTNIPYGTGSVTAPQNLLSPGTPYDTSQRNYGNQAPSGSWTAHGVTNGQQHFQNPTSYGKGYGNQNGIPGSVRSVGTEGQYGPGSIIGRPGSGESVGQYGPGSTGGQLGVQDTGKPYGSGSIGQNGLAGPDGRYIPGSSEGQLGITNGQYNPGVTSGQYPHGGHNGQYGPRGISEQYGPGSGGQYTPGRAGGQYSPGTSSGQYTPEGTSGQYVPGGASGLYTPGSTGGLYNPAVSSGKQTPGGIGGQYGPGSSSGQYTPGSTAGQYGPGGSSGQYTPGSTSGQYNPGSSNGLYGSGGTNALYGPAASSGRYVPGNIGGQYGPEVSGGRYDPEGSSSKYGPGGSGSIPGQNGFQESSGSYGPGIPLGTTGFATPDNKYGIGSTGTHNIPSPGEINSYGGNLKRPGSIDAQNGQYGPSQIPTYYPQQYGNGGVVGQNGNGPYGYDTNIGQKVDSSGTPQNVIDPNSPGDSIDGDDSEAEASVSQATNGTVATASSKGGNEKGRAQTHVNGAYTGSGSFSAQAEISGDNKAANSEVTGDKKGASSNAQGSGKNNKSQANVQLGSETGSVLTGSQSEGVMHSSNTQVQGSVKGGMADAQARGPGSTSSQAQIGFTPYKEGDKSHDLQISPFSGGGTAAAQSSGRTGSSQSQLRGTLKYGITYNGAAQAGASLNKDTVFPNRLPFDKIDVYDESNKNINVNTEKPSDTNLNNLQTTEYLPVPNSLDLPAQTMGPEERPLGNPDEVIPSTDIPFDSQTTTEKARDITNESVPEYSDHAHADHHKTDTQTLVPTQIPPVESRRSFPSTYGSNSGDYEYTTDKDDNLPEDYDVDDGFAQEKTDTSEGEQGEYTSYNEFSRDPEITHQSLQSPKRRGIEVRQTTGGNTQHIVLGSLSNQDAQITQKNSDHPDEGKVYQPGERVPGTGGYTIPIGFTGSVKSVASKDKTFVVGSKDSPSQAQTVSLTPGSGKIKYTYPSTYARNVHAKDLRSLYNPKADDNNRYVSVSKSVTRDLDSENNIRKQYSHTYFTKSSSCGYFSFTCTMVSGAEGRKKVCKPKIPTNSDGSPIKC